MESWTFTAADSRRFFCWSKRGRSTCIPPVTWRRSETLCHSASAWSCSDFQAMASRMADSTCGSSFSAWVRVKNLGMLRLVLQHQHCDVVIFLLAAIAELFHGLHQLGVQFRTTGRSVGAQHFLQTALVEALALRVGRFGDPVAE